MKLLDRRHRWGSLIRDGAVIHYTCRACGKTVSFETIIPAHVEVTLLGVIAKPNVYRAILP